MTSDATVAMPWRPQPDRLAARGRVLSFWRHHKFKVVEADSNPRLPFSLARARNNAVRKITTPRVIVADADTIPDIAAVTAALELDGVTWPYDIYRHIPSEYADKPDLMTAPIDQQYNNSVGGIIITTTQTYWALGGMDEHFQQWGFEDRAFHLAAATLSTTHRTPGIVFSFNHAADRDQSTENPGFWRNQLYRMAANQPQLMKELIKH